MRKFIFILLSLIVLSACRSDKQQDNFTSDTGIKVFRYDRLQYEAVALNSFSALQKMSLECPQATKILIEDVLAIGTADTPEINERLCAYFSDSTLLNLMEDAEVKFKDMSKIEKGFTEGIVRLKKEIPHLRIPRFYAQISALNQSVVVGDSLVGFSIDKYMGEDYPLYRKYYYAYQRRSMTPERILPDCFTSYLISEYPFGWHPESRMLFDILMYHGKINWVVKKILNADSDAEVLGYTPEEQHWCETHKEELWKWMVKEGQLESTDPMIIRAYIHPDPSMIFGGKEVPPLVGVWLGMQLTEQFMKKHSKWRMKDLLECKSFDELLPRRQGR